MRPRPHDEHHRRLLSLGKLDEALDRARGVGVVPAADMQHRDVGGPVVVLHPVPAYPPEVRVVVAVVLHPEVVVLEVGRGRERVLPLPERGQGEPVGGGLPLQPLAHRGEVGDRRQLAVGPAELLAELERPVVSHLVGPGVREPAHGQDQRLQRRGIQLGGVRLGMRPVGRAPHPDLGKRVLEPGDPPDRVEAVRGVELVVLAEHTLGEIEPAHVLNHHDVAVAGEPGGLLRKPVRGLVVGRPVEEDRERLLHRDAVATRAVDIRGEAHPIPHLHHEVRLDADAFVGRGGVPRFAVRARGGAGDPEQTGQHPDPRQRSHGAAPSSR